MIDPVLTRFGNFVRGLWSDTSGVILPYVTILLVVIVGTSVLALDGSRYMSLQSQLQKGADALALAGAAELDRMPNSTTRAAAAVNGALPFVTNSSVFGTGGAANVTVSAINFRDTLPASDGSPIGAPLCSGGGCTLDQSVLARFIEVVVTPTTIPTILPASFIGGGNSVTAGASAVAGMDQVVCKFTPMFICNPFELPDGSMSYGQATEALFNAVGSPAIRRRQIQMRQGGGGGVYSPGNFGFLDSPMLGPGANALRDAIAAVSPSACFAQNGVETKPGFTATIKDAINVRFDLYKGPINPSEDVRPAKNVRKGFIKSAKGNWCGSNPQSPQYVGPPEAMELPKDNCFGPDGNGTCPNMGGRMGDGNWDFDAYWAMNHPTRGKNGWSNANLPSRYEVYRYEIDNGFVNDPSPGGETGAPMCYPTTADDPDRRLLYAAIVNCKATLPPKLPLGPGNQTGIPVAAFGKMFITEPVPDSQDQISAEMVELVLPGDGANKDLVQLYR